MKGLVWLLAAFAAAVGLSLALHDTEGYLLVVLPPWRVELSLVFGVVLLVLAFVALHMGIRIVSATLGLPARVRAFRAQQRVQRGRRALAGAMQALFEGRWSRAEKLAAEAWEVEDPKAPAGLVAARASQRLRDPARRDRWLAQVRDAEPEWRRARLMTEAELLIEERRYDEAKTVLDELVAGGGRHIATMQLQLRAAQGLSNWDEVIRLARQLEKRNALPPEAVESVVTQARVALLGRRMHEPRSLAKAWRDTPESERRQPKVAAAAARAYMRLGDCASAHRILEAALESRWEPSLVTLYGECLDDEALIRIQRAERWLKDHPRDAELLLALGLLCVQCELWGKAQSYLEASLSVSPGRSVHIALAQLFDRIGRNAEADRHYRASADKGLLN